MYSAGALILAIILFVLLGSGAGSAPEPPRHAGESASESADRAFEQSELQQIEARDRPERARHRVSAGLADGEAVEIHVCSCDGAGLPFRSLARFVTTQDLDGVLGQPVAREPFDGAAGLHYLVLRRGAAPALRQWPMELREIGSVPAAEPGFDVQIQIVDASDEQGVPGARVAVDAVGRPVRTAAGEILWSSRTDEHGLAEIRDLPAGKPQLRVLSEGLRPDGHYFAVAVPGEDQVFRVVRARSLTVQFTNLPKSSPEIHYRWRESESTWTGPIPIGPEGMATVAFDQNPDTVDWGVRDPLLGDILPFGRSETRAPPGTEVRFPDTCDLTIRAVSALGPCEMYSVVARHAGHTGAFQPRLLGDYPGGVCRIRGVIPGTRAIAVLPVAADLARSDVTEVELRPGTEERLDFIVPAALPLLVSVLDAEREPVRGAEVRVIAGSPDDVADLLTSMGQDARLVDRSPRDERDLLMIGAERTDESGLAAFRLRRKHVSIVVRHERFLTAALQDLHWPWPPVVDLVMSSGGSVRVVSPEQWPDGFDMVLHAMDQPWRRTLDSAHVRRPGADLVSVVEGLREGRWRGEVRYQNAVLSSVPEIEVVSGEQTTVELPVGMFGLEVVRGRANGPEGVLANVGFVARRVDLGLANPGAIQFWSDSTGHFEISLPNRGLWVLGTPEQDEWGGTLYAFAKPWRPGNPVRAEWYFVDRVDAHYAVYADGLPIREGRVDLTHDSGVILAQRTTDAEGRLRVRSAGGNLYPPYRLTLTHGGRSAVVDPLPDSSAPGQVTRIDLR